MGRSKGRRNTVSNRRLPTRTARFTTNTYSTLAQMRQLLYPNTYQWEPYVPTYRSPTKAIVKSHLAKNYQKSAFPQTYGVNSVPQSKTSKELSAPKTICESRKERTEVLFAKNQTGKSGQKRPNWTLKSKVKC